MPHRAVDERMKGLTSPLLGKPARREATCGERPAALVCCAEHDDEELGVIGVELWSAVGEGQLHRGRNAARGHVLRVRRGAREHHEHQRAPHHSHSMVAGGLLEMS